ncbi:MAG: hypothetical protein ACJ73S_11635 [Mycobacteriales bacterium]
MPSRITSRPWLLFLAVRRTVDFHRTALAGRARYYASLVGALFAVVSTLFTPVTFSIAAIVGVASLAFSVACLIPEWSGARRYRIRLTRVPNPRFPRLRSDGRTVRLPSEYAVESEVAVAWPDIDAAFMTTEATCSWSRIRKRLSPRISRYAYDILRIKTAGKPVYNGKVIRQNADLTADLLRENGDLELSGTDYFSLLCSNYMTNFELRDALSDIVVLRGVELTADQKNRLIGLAESELANVIGVSTIALTTDGRLVLVGQGGLAQSSASLWAPSGSGSMDLRDIRVLKSGSRRLRDVVAAAMERELVEESHVTPRDIEWTEVLGYFRWLTKGGKPEYVGVTRLRLSSEDFVNRRVRITETPFVDSILASFEIDLDLLAANPDRPTELLRKFRPHTSMPLFMCVRALGHRLRADPDLRERLARRG